MSGADQMPPSQLSRPEFLTAWLRRERYIDRPGAYRIRKISRKASMIMQALTVSDDGSSRGAIESGPRRRIGAQGLMFRTCGREPFEQKSPNRWSRSEEHTSELQSLRHLVCRLLLEKKEK